MPPVPNPYSPETIATEEEVALLRESPKASGGIPDDLRHEGLPPREARVAGGRRPWTERLAEVSPVKIVAITLALVGGIFFVRRSVMFNIIYEALIVEVGKFFKDSLFSFLTFVQDLDAVSGPVLFALVYALCIVFFLPVTVLNLAAGFCFGIVPGFMSVSTGGVVGASIAFLLGRTVARDMVGTHVASSFDSTTLDNLLQRNPNSAFKIICLSRLPPCLPFPCVNYSYSLTNVPFWTYFWATWLGLAPGTFAYVYMGSAIRNLADVVSGTHSGGPVYFVVLALGVFGTFAVAIYLMREAQLALGMEKTSQDQGESPRSTGAGSSGGKSSGLFGIRNRVSASTSPRNYTERRKTASPAQPAVPGKKHRPVALPDAERELKREGEFLLFSGKKRKQGRPGEKTTKRTLTRNSSIWNLFKTDSGNDIQSSDQTSEARHRAETNQLEYFL